MSSLGVAVCAAVTLHLVSGDMSLPTGESHSGKPNPGSFTTYKTQLAAL